MIPVPPLFQSIKSLNHIGQACVETKVDTSNPKVYTYCYGCKRLGRSF